MMYREPGGKPPQQPEQPPKFYVVWSTLYCTDSFTSKFKSELNYEAFDSIEEAQACVEFQHKKNPNTQTYMFYGFLALPKVKRRTEVIEHVETTYEVK